MFLEISPLDGRYRDRLEGLPEYFSEFALMRERCAVEIAYLEALEDVDLFPPFTQQERARIDTAKGRFTEDDFARIKQIERETHHDVKSCELFLRETLDLANPNRIHFGLTSEDVTNLAYGRILDRYRREQQLPQLMRLIETMAELVDWWKAVPFPARTHGQSASPTTLGKEFAVFLSRLLRQTKQLQDLRFRGKLNGATGNYSALVVAFPAFDWQGFSSVFVKRLGLEPNPCTTQIEGHDGLAEYFGIVSRIHNILLGLDLDLWEYVSRGDLVERPVHAEVGSSTMPHKVNPIRFENSEGNLTISNALLHVLSEKLTRSRMQRDLSGTTVERNIGVALAHSYLAVGQTLDGLSRLDVDPAGLREKVDRTPEVLAEAYQTILRTEEIEDPYELLRGATRGAAVTLAALYRWIDELPVSDDVKARMKALRPSDYIGLATEICEAVVSEAKEMLNQ